MCGSCRLKRCFECFGAVHFKGIKSEPKFSGCYFVVLPTKKTRIIPQQHYSRYGRNNFLDQLQPLTGKQMGQQHDTGNVAAWPAQTGG